MQFTFPCCGRKINNIRCPYIGIPICEAFCDKCKKYYYLENGEVKQKMNSSQLTSSNAGFSSILLTKKQHEPASSIKANLKQFEHRLPDMCIGKADIPKTSPEYGWMYGYFLYEAKDDSTLKLPFLPKEVFCKLQHGLLANGIWKRTGHKCRFYLSSKDALDDYYQAIDIGSPTNSDRQIGTLCGIPVVESDKLSVLGNMELTLGNVEWTWSNKKDPTEEENQAKEPEPQSEEGGEKQKPAFCTGCHRPSKKCICESWR